MKKLLLLLFFVSITKHLAAQKLPAFNIHYNEGEKSRIGERKITRLLILTWGTMDIRKIGHDIKMGLEELYTGKNFTDTIIHIGLAALSDENIAAAMRAYPHDGFLLVQWAAQVETAPYANSYYAAMRKIRGNPIVANLFLNGPFGFGGEIWQGDLITTELPNDKKFTLKLAWALTELWQKQGAYFGQ